MIYKKLEDVFPRESSILVHIYIITMSAIVLGLNFKQILIGLLIDSASYLVLLSIDLKLFYKIFPKFLIFREYETNKLSNSPNLHFQQQYYTTISQFPATRTMYVLAVSILKVLPAGIYVASVQNQTGTFAGNIGLYYLSELFILVFYCGLLFIQLHKIASKQMENLKSTPEWKNNYLFLRLNNIKDNFAIVQNGVLSSMLINLLTLTFVITRLEQIKGNQYLFILYGSAFLCIGSIQYKFQKFFRDSLQSMFNYLEQDFATGEIKTLPLHTSPILAGFESTINQLGHNLQARELEIQEWLKYESDQFHMRSLGEITALVAHDIKNPLHVMQMSLDMMNDPNTDQATKEKYCKILSKNLSQTITFTKSLMAYLRGQDNDQTCSFFEIHNHLLDLFETQYPSADFKSIHFDISDDAETVTLKISRLDAMHIFYNIYNNAIKSVLARKNETIPTITITAKIENDFVHIIVQDNGLGMNPQRFEQLTSFNRFEKGQDLKKGLGLRITKTLVNHLKGNLVTEESEIGARLRVDLPIATEVRVQHSTQINQELTQTLS